MSKHNYFLRYVLIIKTLRGRSVLFPDIQRTIEKAFDYRGESITYNLRTFQRDKSEIMQLFNIEIVCNSHSEYYIKTDDSSLTEINYRLLEIFDLVDSLQTKKDIEKYIQLESRSNQRSEFITDILSAIKRRKVIELFHLAFTSEETTRRVVYPYGIKEFKGRWYILAYDTKKKAMRTFGLDRINFLNILPQEFVYQEKYNISDYFKNSFGIVHNHISPEHIVLSVDKLYGKYLKTRPLHHSQRIVETNEYECHVELFLAPTYDFIQELLSMFERVKVLEPAHLKEELLCIHQLCIKRLS